MADEPTKQIVDAQKESTNVLSNAIAKLEQTVASSGSATEEGQTQLKDTILNTSKPDPKVKETEEKQSSFLERIQKSMQGMNLANAKDRMGQMRTDAAESFAKRKEAIMSSRSGALMKGMAANISKFTKGFLGSIASKAKFGLKAFFIATGMLMLYNFLESEEWAKIKEKIKNFDFKKMLKKLDGLIAGFKNILGGIYTYFMGGTTEDGKNDGTGLFARISNTFKSFKEKGILGGIKDMWKNFSGLELAIVGIVAALVLPKALLAGGILFAIKGIWKGFKLLWSAVKGIGSFLGFMKPSLNKATAKTLKAATKANPKLGQAIMSKDGNIVREFTDKGKVNPKFQMAKNLGKSPAVKATIKPTNKLMKLMAARAAGKSLLKKIPGLGLLAGGAFAIQKLLEGDTVGAGMELASGGASLVPGAGTAASAGIDVAILLRELERNKDMLPKLQGEQAALQKKMAERAKFREMFGLSEGNMFDRNKMVAMTDHRGNPIKMRDGSTAMKRDTLRDWAKRTFGNQRLTKEQAEMASKFMPGKVVEGESMQSIARSRGRDFFVSQKDSFKSMQEADKGLTEFIDTIKAVNGELQNMQKEAAAQQQNGGTQIINNVSDNSRSETSAHPIHQMPPRNVPAYAGPW